MDMNLTLIGSHQYRGVLMPGCSLSAHSLTFQLGLFSLKTMPRWTPSGETVTYISGFGLALSNECWVQIRYCNLKGQSARQVNR